MYSSKAVDITVVMAVWISVACSLQKSVYEEEGLSELKHRVKQFELSRQSVLYEKGEQILNFQPLDDWSYADLTHMKAIVESENNSLTSDVKSDTDDPVTPSQLTGRRKRQVRLSAIRGANVWPRNIVPYYIDLSTYTSGYSQWRIKSAVAAGLRSLEELSCVRFIERSELDETTRASLGHSHSVRVFNGVNCWSHSGCTNCRRGDRNTTQDLSMATRCTSNEIVQHEFGHVLGLTHEHTRTDMHEHIAVNYSLVRDPAKFYRKTHPEFINKAPYDLTSIQHYQTSALVTHNPEDMWLKSGIGRLTHYDEWSINAAYCSDGCDKSLCKNDGYMTNKDGSCKCVCPEGLAGPTCEETSSEKEHRCGGVIQLTLHKQYTTIQTPNYPRPYSTRSACTWLIKAPTGKTIHSRITDMDLPANRKGCEHFVEIRDKLIGQVARQKCGRCSNRNCFTSKSTGNTALIIFDAVDGNKAGRGIQISIQLKDDCSQCRGASCHEGRCQPKYGGMYCDFEQGLLEGCADLRVHDAYQKSYDDLTWTESAWEIAERGPKLPNQSSGTRSAEGRLHLLSLRPRPLTRGPYEGSFRIVPYLIYPGRSRCLRFKLFLCCDSRVNLKVYTATDGVLSTSPLLTVTDHSNQWQDVKLQVNAPTHITRAEPIEVVFKSSHSVSAQEGKAHLGIDNIAWTYGTCR